MIHEKLKTLFERLKLNNLRIQPDKCEFLRKGVAYLGHIISKNGVKMDLWKSEVIDKLKIAPNYRELKSFLGLTGYYRRFVNNYAEIVEPLNKLLRKNVEYIWTKEFQIRFENIKEIPKENKNKKFIFTIDASNNGIGAVLSQENDTNRERPIMFLS